MPMITVIVVLFIILFTILLVIAMSWYSVRWRMMTYIVRYSL